MVTALVWDNAKAFQRHLESMTVFRRSHQNIHKSGLAQLNDMPAQGYTIPPDEAGGARGFFTMRGKPTVVPIWEITLPYNSQN